MGGKQNREGAPVCLSDLALDRPERGKLHYRVSAGWRETPVCWLAPRQTDRHTRAHRVTEE